MSEASDYDALVEKVATALGFDTMLSDVRPEILANLKNWMTKMGFTVNTSLVEIVDTWKRLTRIGD